MWIKDSGFKFEDGNLWIKDSGFKFEDGNLVGWSLWFQDCGSRVKA